MTRIVCRGWNAHRGRACGNVLGNVRAYAAADGGQRVLLEIHHRGRAIRVTGWQALVLVCEDCETEQAALTQGDGSAMSPLLALEAAPTNGARECGLGGPDNGR